MINRPIILFLLANFVVGTFLLFNFKNKAAEKISTQVITPIVAVAPAPVTPAIAAVSTVSTVSDIPNISPPIQQPVKEKTPPICMEYGPLDIEQKSIVDNIFNKEKVAIHKDKRSQYEVYWNLGANEDQAREMFAKQKEGALQDSKFQLNKVDNFWMVSITTVSNSLDTAKALSIQLSDKANKANIGGRWQYRTLPEAYYYQIKDINEVSSLSLEKLTKGMAINKKPCEV